ncbi:hypothetical protein LIER_11508 [Lithospermum erythrorhizon]|uniref:Uncharacterized protein n=1 Tax=Lithospermum erythrorhizon TaxID=34254 RepID=A0AAV3PQJ6_LITER
MDARVPKVWVPLAKAHKLKSPPTDETFTALEKFKRVFRQKMHWKIFYEERLYFSSTNPHFPFVQERFCSQLRAVFPLADMRGKRPIAFKRVKAVNKVDSSPHPASKTIPTPRSSPIVAEPSSSSLPPSAVDLTYKPPSPSLAEKRPSEGSFHAVRPLLLEGFPLEVYGDMCRYLIQARRVDFLGEENRNLKAQVPSDKAASLEEELNKVKWGARGEPADQRPYLGLCKKHEDVATQRDKIKAESSCFNLQITQLSGIRDVVLAKASRSTQETKRLEEEVKRLEDVASQYPKAIWAAVENFKQTTEFEGALSTDVESFKKSPEFIDALGLMLLMGLIDLNLDAPCKDEEDEEATPPSNDAAPKA